jgi:hypothetical protein
MSSAWSTGADQGGPKGGTMGNRTLRISKTRAVLINSLSAIATLSPHRRALRPEIARPASSFSPRTAAPVTRRKA